MKTHADDPVIIRLSPIVHAPEQLENLVDREVNSAVVLDVSDLGFATSMFLNELLELRRSIVGRGHRLIICCSDDRVRGVFNITGLNQVFTIVYSQTEALDMLKNADQERHSS
ncbi:MAG: STAS domain-containing protein [Planctomycetota bacterium]